MICETGPVMTLLLSHHLDRFVVPRIGLLADTVNDADSTRKVYLLAAGLAVLGVALVVVTVWFWRSTRHDPELLAPLEVMGGRRFKRLEGGVQREMLDRSRPAAAEPMRWGVRRGEASGGPEIDLRENQRSTPAGYDDLLDPALIAVAVAETDDHARGRVPVAEHAPTPEPAGVSSAVDDIDSALAAVGAKVDLPVASAPVPPAAPVVPSRPSAVTVSPAGTGAAASAAAASAVASTTTAPGASAKPAVADGPPNDAADGPVLTPRGNKPGAKPNEAQPLVIVPVDHELRPARPQAASKAGPGASTEPADADNTVDAEQPVLEEPTSIDPLLRMLNRNDG